jgi:hypothetical protein
MKMNPAFRKGLVMFTLAALTVAGFVFTMWNITELARTNQLIHLLGVLVSFTMMVLYLWVLLIMIDET